MIISVEKLKSQVDYGELTDDVIETRLNAIESVIRAFTNNNFQNRHVRFNASSGEGNTLNSGSPFLKAGDTIQISQSKVNDGLYSVIEATEEYTVVEEDLYQVLYNLVTKVEYPADVIQCAVDLFKWQMEYGAKVGIKSESETLSRHSVSVTYEDSSSLYLGYPVGILNGLSLYKKMRC